MDVSDPEKNHWGYEVIWKTGIRISGGMGFWGSSELLGAENPATLVRAWVDGLTSLGYSQPDIAMYGDWTDGRHIADQAQGLTESEDEGYAEFLAIVKRSARRHGEVHHENLEHYGRQRKARTEIGIFWPAWEAEAEKFDKEHPRPEDIPA